MRKRLILVATLIFTILLATPESAQPQGDSLRDDVKASISLGVDYLKRTQLRSGVWDYLGQFDPGADQVIGCAALCGIALMEAGVPTNDKQVLATAAIVRAAANNSRFNYNYGVCLSVLFLDRLHRDDKAGLKHSDASTIMRLGKLIAAGQSQDGGWTYQLSGSAPISDNSNTQFAVVALWVARKYAPGGVVDQSLRRADVKFRKTQGNNGGWGYDAVNIQLVMGSTGSMTCAGILGIALNAGVRKQSETAFRGAGAAGSSDVYALLEKDPQVARAKAFLLTEFNDYINNRSKHGHITYFFWSLERVATLYRWKKLDDANTVDWYELGARYLMRIQNKQRGMWEVDFLQGPAVDTSFALLFLSKSNLLSPLQEAEFTDPGDGALTAGLTKKAETKPEPKNHEQFAKELTTKALGALANERQNTLNDLRDAPLLKENDFYTAALVEAIGRFETPTAKEMAREALAGRLRNLPPEKLILMLNDNNRELRLAAVTAVKLTNNLDAASGLIPLLSDKDEGVATAALESLKHISSQDFGKSVDRWSRWLTTIKGQKPQ